MARQAFSVCHIGQFVYVIGGVSPHGLLNDVWQYDIEQNSWTELKRARVPVEAISLKILAVERRYIYGLTNDRHSLS